MNICSSEQNDFFFFSKPILLYLRLKIRAVEADRSWPGVASKRVPLFWQPARTYARFQHTGRHEYFRFSRRSDDGLSLSLFPSFCLIPARCRVFEGKTKGCRYWQVDEWCFRRRTTSMARSPERVSSIIDVVLQVQKSCLLFLSLSVIRRRSWYRLNIKDKGTVGWNTERREESNVAMYWGIAILSILFMSPSPARFTPLGYKLTECKNEFPIKAL